MLSSNSLVQGLKKLIYSPVNIKKLEELLEKLHKSQVYIYGAGNAGAMTYTVLEEANIPVQGFLDRRADTCSSYIDRPVLKADDSSITASDKSNSFIIISFVCNHKELQELKEWLKTLGFIHVCYFRDINILTITKDRYFKCREFGDKIFGNSVEETILKVASLLADDISKKVYYDSFNALLNMDSGLFTQPDSGQKQYFVDDIMFARGYSRFIDCGAFDGDTVKILKECKGTIERIAAFEPDGNNFNKLRQNLNGLRVADEEIFFPCGVWSKTEMLRFKSEVQVSSRISEAGDTFIQGVALDDVLQGFAPTFIKMDIEGAEIEALHGAESMIQEYTPDLAISVYHAADHIWKIPLLINSFHPKYKFYLRSHDIHGMETILYAHV